MTCLLRIFETDVAVEKSSTTRSSSLLALTTGAPQSPSEMKRYWRIEPQNDEVLDDDVDKIKLKASNMNARALSLDMVIPKPGK